MISRRTFLLAGAGLAAGCDRLPWREVTPVINRPGMQQGHALRHGAALPAPSREVRTEVAILGSGVAALTAAWKLAREGFKDFLLLSGPEFGGNASGGAFGGLRYPCGAHYLPLPSLESDHVREMLADLGVIQRNAHALRPSYDERCIVHAPDERLFYKGAWRDGLLPAEQLPPEEARQHERFLALVEQLKSQQGSDGRKLFAIPLALSSRDAGWRSLDAITFQAWLRDKAYTSPTLHWYLDYICRDEYGAGYDKVSAWAGLHYFASRAGQAENATAGAVLTWPDGLHALVQGLHDKIRAANPGAFLQGSAARITERGDGLEVLCLDGHTESGSAPRTTLIRARRVICAMPLYMASRLTDLKRFGFDARDHMPSYAPWTVSNFLMNGFPPEEAGVPLAWDNVVYGGRGLGYVVSTHQDIRAALPPKTVFSAYHALSARTPHDARNWLLNADAETLYDEVASDLKEVYGWHVRRQLEALSITVRGHAMASPLPGYLSNKGLLALREADGKVLFAHSDLSGYSVFEEAAWWGYAAAERVLG
jgi:glycine/D-amino acid oxidase-like deaminating enzyme